MILHLTSQDKGMRICIVADSVTVTDLEGREIWGSTRLARGCNVHDGKHNNGGYMVEESYDEVLAMIESQR
jgi:hypothetical protein